MKRSNSGYKLRPDYSEKKKHNWNKRTGGGKINCFWKVQVIFHVAAKRSSMDLVDVPKKDNKDSTISGISNHLLHI